MKYFKTLSILVALILLIIFLIIITNKSKDNLNQYFGIDKDMLGEIIYQYEDETNFLGDGHKLVEYEIKDLQLIQDIKTNKNAQIVPDYINKFIRFSDYYFPDNGYYILYDKQEKIYTTLEKIYLTNEMRTYNYYLIIVNENKKSLVYYELNT